MWSVDRGIENAATTAVLSVSSRQPETNISINGTTQLRFENTLCCQVHKDVFAESAKGLETSL